MGDREQLIDINSRNGQQSDVEVPRANRSSNSTVVDSTTPNEPVVFTSQVAAFLCILNVTVGAGLLAMPYASQASGLVTSIIMMAVFAAAVVVTCIMCTELTVKANVESYHKIVQKHCHNYIYQFCQACILLLVFGTAVAYIVIIGDQSDRIFASLYGHTFCYTWYMSRTFIMSIVTVMIVKPLCCARTVEFLKYASFAGLLGLAFVVYVVISEFIKRGNVAQHINYVPKDWSNIGSILPVFCLAFQCHLSWVPTVATMKKEEKYTTYYTISAAMIVAALIYTIVCIFALLTFGDTIESDLTESFSGNTWTVLATIGIIAFKCVVTLPLAFLPLRLSLVDILSKVSNRFNNFGEATKRISVTLITLNIALSLALFIPDILMAVDVLGCFSVMFVFSIPAICYLSLVKENRIMKQEEAGVSDPHIPIYSLKDKIKIALSYTFIVFGLIMMVVVLYKSIEKIVENRSSAPICYKN